MTLDVRFTSEEEEDIPGKLEEDEEMKRKRATEDMLKMVTNLRKKVFLTAIIINQ